MIGRIAAGLPLVPHQDGIQIEGIDDIRQKVHQMSFWHPVLQGGWEQKQLIRVIRTIGLLHRTPGLLHQRASWES
jgi:hypothetical protein